MPKRSYTTIESAALCFKRPKTHKSNESKCQHKDAQRLSRDSLGTNNVSLDDDVDISVDNDASENNSWGDGGISSPHCQSSFESHMEHKLSEQDTDNLLKRRWSYGCYMPASSSSSCRWMGTGDGFLKDVAVTAPYGLKGNLYKQWLEVYNTSRGEYFHSSQQRLFFSLCNSYRDILHPNQEVFYKKGSGKVSSTMDAYIMHSLNHVFKSRDLVMRNNANLAKTNTLSNDGFCDQGFTRAKVLILLPVASVARLLVRRLIQLTPSSNKVNVEHMDRFNKEFGVGIEEGKDEFKAFLGEDMADNFAIGLKFTRKTIRLYNKFTSSDMIIASPLGLKMEIAKAKSCKEKDVDYLSSIEILIVDHADIMLMQDWTHVRDVVEHLNLLPSNPIKTDITRVRHWSSNARFYRQTIILASYLNPDINALFNQNCLNFEGKLQSSCEYGGVLSKIPFEVHQLLPRIKKESFQGGIMLFVSSSLDYLRLRNLLKSQDVSFCMLDEYMKKHRDITCARNWFVQGHRKVMLYNERAQFYKRYKIRGVQHLIVYSVPQRAEIYPEILNMLEGSHERTCTVLFSRLDKLQLERIVGTATAKRMTTSEKEPFILK